MDDQSDGQALRAQIGALRHPISKMTRVALRTAVRQYVDTLRELGWPPERVIIAVKSLAREAGLNPTKRVTVLDAQLDNTDALLVEIVGWVIERYYYRSE